MIVAFAIDETLPTVNAMLRLHWRQRTRIAKRVQKLVWIALTKLKLLPMAPMQRVHIRIKRYSRQAPDPDGLATTAKILLDVLQPCSKRHPHGLGVIADDSSACIASLHVEHVSKRLARTEVEIELA